MFGPYLSMKSMSIAFRSLHTMLHSGVAIDKAFRVIAERNPNTRTRAAFDGIYQEVKKGSDVSSAMKKQEVFPDLVLDMVDVAELTGTLPEVLAALADHYDNMLRLRQTFIQQISWPVIQLFIAILVIGGLIFLLGMIADSQGGEPMDVLGWGLVGTSGAMTWFMMTFGSAFALFVAWQVTTRSLAGQKFLDSTLLKIPVIGYCMQSFAIARFSWAFHLTQQAGMEINRSIESSLRATNNGAFQAAAPEVVYLINSGESFTDSIAATGLFPREYLEIVHVAETTGTVPEQLHRMSPQFEEQARRALSAMTATLGWVVWLIVAGFIIFCVFSIVFWYLGLLNDAMQAI